MCLNCGAALDGPFCAQCGQRAVPAYPTLREYAGDAWEEMAGFDGRFARTIRTLLRHPGRLTVETLEGRRSRYIKPLRLYLSASVLYFLVAAAAPNIVVEPKATIPGESHTEIDLLDANALTPEQKARALKDLERAPAPFRKLLRPIIDDPVGFRTRMIDTISKVFFVMVPLFAAITGMFYRGRRFMQHLTFALHLHAMAFFVFSFIQATQFTTVIPLIITLSVIALGFLAWYLVRAQRVVYGNGLAATLLKSAGIAVVYSLAWFPALTAALLWGVWSR
jgi:hypothetical protein